MHLALSIIASIDMGTHAAIISQQAGSAMQCVRVTDGTVILMQTAVVGSTDITFTALYTGSFGNNITVVLQTGAKANTIAAVVSVPGYATEIFQNIPAPPTVVTTTTASSSSSTTLQVALRRTSWLDQWRAAPVLVDHRLSPASPTARTWC